MTDWFSILAVANKAHDLVHPTRRGIFFKYARQAGYGFY